MPVLTGKGDTFELDLIKLIFNGAAIADIAENDTSEPLTNLEVALHTADPTDAGVQTASECAYTGYARVPVARSVAGWTAANPTTNVVAITFGECSGAAPETAKWFSVGTAHAGAGKILYGGMLTADLVINVGVTPSFAIGALSIAEG